MYSRLTAFAYITHHEHYVGQHDYRSWAPRWDDMNVTRILGLQEQECPWRPCDKLRVSKIDDDHLNFECIRLKGIIYNVVRDVEATMDYSNMLGSSRCPSTKADTNYPYKALPPLIQVIMTLCPGFPERIKDDEQSFVHTLARTITAGTWDILDPKYIEHLNPPTQTRFYAAFHHFISRTMKLHRIDTLRRYPHTTDSARFEADAADTCSLRRIFWTENGSFGLGPQCMLAGDIVVVLYGGNTPYVLRPKQHGYLFMGQAYVDAIMHGEVMDSLRAGQVQEQFFNIV
jgi:hypothetical protein